MQVRRQDAGLGVRLQHDRAGAVAEQHAGAAVFPVDHPRQRLGADHEDGLVDARADVRVGDAQRVEEARARGIDVERAAAVGTEAVLHEAGGGRKDEIGRGRAEHDHVEFGRLHAGGFHRRARGALGEVGGGLALGDDVALADAGARRDPFVAGIDELLEVGVGQDPGRQGTAGTGETREHGHGLPFLT